MPTAPEQRPTRLVYNEAGQASFAEFKTPLFPPIEDPDNLHFGTVNRSSMEEPGRDPTSSAQRPTPSTEGPPTHQASTNRQGPAQLHGFSSKLLETMGSDIEEFAPANLGLDSRRQTGTFGKNERRIDKLSDGLYSTLPSHRSV